jgi:hypothetical protein
LTASPLETLAREFAGDISELLNRTITDGIRFSTVLREPTLCIAAVGIGKRDLRPEPIPVTVGRKKPPSAFLFVAYVLEMDAEGKYLTVNQSQIGLYATREPRSMVFHYDYNRMPANEYPSAHFQVAGKSASLSTVVSGRSAASKSLRDLHFPLGGRRFRPTVEDVVEFLIVEELADAKPGWELAVEERLEAWKEIQIRAAVRRNPDWAREALREVPEPK